MTASDCGVRAPLTQEEGHESVNREERTVRPRCEESQKSHCRAKVLEKGLTLGVKAEH